MITSATSITLAFAQLVIRTFTQDNLVIHQIWTVLENWKIVSGVRRVTYVLNSRQIRESRTLSSCYTRNEPYSAATHSLAAHSSSNGEDAVALKLNSCKLACAPVQTPIRQHENLSVRRDSLPNSEDELLHVQI